MSATCKHHNPYQLAASRHRGTEGNGSHRVLLCRDCGRFTVVGSENGEDYEVSFTIVRPEHLQAAGRYMELLEAARQREPQLF